MVQEENKEWRGSPLDISDAGLDYEGIKEIVLQFDNGDEFVFRPTLGGEFGSYELHMMAVGLDTVAHEARRNFS